jgi:hypothetical protein
MFDSHIYPSYFEFNSKLKPHKLLLKLIKSYETEGKTEDEIIQRLSKIWRHFPNNTKPFEYVLDRWKYHEYYYGSDMVKFCIKIYKSLDGFSPYPKPILLNRIIHWMSFGYESNTIDSYVETFESIEKNALDIAIRHDFRALWRIICMKNNPCHKTKLRIERLLLVNENTIRGFIRVDPNYIINNGLMGYDDIFTRYMIKCSQGNTLNTTIKFTDIIIIIN